MKKAAYVHFLSGYSSWAETKQKYHLGFKLITFTLINLREFCTV
jgi:hypothetical protein